MNNNKKIINIRTPFCTHFFMLAVMLATIGISYAEDIPSLSDKRVSNSRKLQGLRSSVFQTRAEVEAISIKLRQLGFETNIKELKRGFLVNAGAFQFESNLKKALNRLQKAGLADKIHVVEMGRKKTKVKTVVKRKKIRSTVFSSAQDKNSMDDFVPKKDYVKLEQEVGTLKAQMQLLLEKLALTEEDLNKGRVELKPKEQEDAKTEEKNPESQQLAKVSQIEKSKPAKVKSKKNKEETEDDEVTREDEAEEAKRGLDTFLRGKKVMYRPGELEIELGLAYGQGTSVNTFAQSLATNKFRSNAKLITRSVDSNFTMRYGIIDDLEFNLNIPYGYYEVNADQQPFHEAEGLDPVSHRNAIGIGDISGTLNYGVLSEKGNIPTVTLSLSGQTPTGNYNRGLGAGFWGVGGGVSLVKTIDPVVFFGSFGYSVAFEERGIDPSDTVSYSIGAGYSMNDRVSFSTSLTGMLTGRAKKDGIERPGSSVDSHSLQFSTTIQLSKQLSVEPFVGFGLTEDASDFAVGVRFPYRFELLHPIPFFSD